MSSAASTGGLVPPLEPPRGIVFQRPAELVDVSERIYRQVFAVGLWVAAGLSAFAAAASLLQPDAGSRFRGFAVCAVFAAACVVSAVRPAPIYRALRHRPWLLLGPGVVLGLGSWFVGVRNFQLFMPLIVIVGVPGIATPRRVVIAAAVVAGIGLGVPHVVDGDGNLGGPIAVIVPPLLFWLIVDRIAGFALRLHQSLALSNEQQARATADPGRHESPTEPTDVVDHEDGLAELPEPEEIVVAGVKLTARQLQVVMLVCEGLRHDEIARCLEIGVPMVRRHLEKARKRVGVGSTPELVAWAFAVELVPRAI